MKKPDPRVAALRCTGCHRLRPHPRKGKPNTFACGCGSIEFIETGLHSDEEAIAKQLYRDELDESGIYLKIGQEILDGWKHEDYSYLK